MGLKNNYYVSAFAWSTLSKILTAIFGFFSVPLLLGLYGKADFGILSIATACNGYMNLLDLGMNSGAVRYYACWLAEGKREKIYRVSRTNLTFYIIISILNAFGLVLLAMYGRSLFSITDVQFLLLQKCLIILAVFAAFQWCTTAFNQLLIADKEMTFTMQVQCFQTLLKGALIVVVLTQRLPLTVYFFFLTFIVALSLIPYAARCKSKELIDTFKPATYWKDFKVVITFSLSIFALGLFQMSATQTRPIILSMFADNGAVAVTEYRIVEVVPYLIIMIGGTFSGIFLPKASEMVAKNEESEIKRFCYGWTRITSIIICYLTFPFIINAPYVLSAYVGKEYANLSIWLIIWCVTVLIQMHTTPANSVVLGYGKTKILVIVTSIACVSSIILNAFLCQIVGVGSAIISYFLYVLIIIGLYYLVFYKKLLHLSRAKMFIQFIRPTLVAAFLALIVYCVPLNIDSINWVDERLGYIIICIIKSILWIIPYTVLLFVFKLISREDFKK